MSIKELFPYLVIVVLMIMLIQKPKEVVRTVEIPAKENSFTHHNPQPVVKWDTIYKDRIVEKVVPKENPVNKELLRKYQEAQDSITKLNLYRDAITTRVYEETYEDSVQTITVLSEVTGTLEKQSLSYTIQSIQKEFKNPSEGLYMGAGVSFPYRYLDIPSLNVDVGYLYNNTMYSVGLGTNQHITINVKKKIF